MKREEVGVDIWRAALLREDSGRLVGLARNYLGGVKTPFDKRDLVRNLEAFLARPETGAAIAGLLDAEDIRILGTIRLAGVIGEPALKGLFLGELPLAELGSRLENLRDRLLVFAESGPAHASPQGGAQASPQGAAQAAGQRYAVNPVLLPAIGERIGDLRAVFGPRQPGDAGADAVADAAAAASARRDGNGNLAMQALALLAFMSAHPSALRKHGGVSGKAKIPLARICPDLPQDQADAILRAFARVGAAGAEDGGAFAGGAFGGAAAQGTLPAVAEHDPQRDSGGSDIGRLTGRLRQHWNLLPWYLAINLAGGDPGGAGALEAAMGPFASGEFEFDAFGLARLLRLASFISGAGLDDPGLADAMIALGMLAPAGNAIRCVRGAVDTAAMTSPGSTRASGSPVLAVEGSGILHLMPEAGLDDRLFVMGVASPLRLSAVWDFELDRPGLRRAFSSGFAAEDIIRRLESMAGHELPQTVRFSVRSWAEEFQHLRLFRGTVMAVDPPTEEILARSGVAARLGAHKLGPGIYFLGSLHHDRIEAELKAIGMDAPPLSQDSGPAGRQPADFADYAEFAAGRWTGAAYGHESGYPEIPWGVPAVSADSTGRDLSPLRDLPLRRDRPQESFIADLRAAVEALALPEARRADIEERVSRKLVLGMDQLAALAGPSSGERQRPAPVLRDLSAGAMDYQGKLRLVKQALKSPLDRLDVQWTDAEGTRRAASLRPVRIEQNQKGHVLEAEDIGSGGPLRISIGALSAVRLVRASYFGDEP